MSINELQLPENYYSILKLMSTLKQDKSREELEAEIIPRFTSAVNLGLKVLEDAFITVEVKPNEGIYNMKPFVTPNYNRILFFLFIIFCVNKMLYGYYIGYNPIPV